MPRAPTDIDDDPTQPATGAALSWTEAGEPRSTRFGDVYFSRDDGLGESRAVFLAGCDLPGAWADRDQFTVAELGFGTGLNIVALLDLWRRERAADQGRTDAQLNVFTIEAWPLSAAEAARALSGWPDLADIVELLIARWPAATPGFHRIDLPELSATIDLAIGDVEWALDQWQGRADAWFLDGFSPAANPAMWSPAVFAAIADRSAPDARLATFTVAGAVRRGLADQGFQVDRRPGHGRKRERLEARGTGSTTRPSSRSRLQPSVVVIGAGIAGAAVVRALAPTGADVVLIEAERPGAGGSGFPAALVTPRLDAGDVIIASFHAQALARARQLYGSVAGAVVADGVLQLEQAPRDAGRFAKIVEQPWWSPGEMSTARLSLDRLSVDGLSVDGLEPAQTHALRIDTALVIRPGVVLKAWFGDVATVTGQVGRIERAGATWQVFDTDGALLAQADQVVMAAGWGTSELTPTLDLRPVRGQADWVVDAAMADPTATTAVPAMAWGGYLVPTGDGLLFGATHDRGDTTTQVRADDSLHNRATLAARLPGLAARVASVPQADCGARAAVRATTPDRLPVCGAIDEGLYVLGGLGSRGFCVAPLLAEHLASLIVHRPSPLPAAFAARLSPSRALRGPAIADDAAPHDVLPVAGGR